MDWNQHALLWNHALIRMMDIRFLTLPRGSEPYIYRLPASGFMYVASGQAKVHAEADTYQVEQHDLLHGGKGIRLVIEPDEEWFSFYLILYKATLTYPRSRQIHRLYAEIRPFDIPYVCSLTSTSLLQGLLADMIRHWQHPLPVYKLKVKASFYQFVFELMRMLDEQEREGSKPDLVELTVRYLQENYQKSITMDELAVMFNCSVSHLSRAFKHQMGASPIHYLIQIRMEHAKELLLGSKASLKTIADRIGYPDGFYFSRMFKKHTGYSPQHYRNLFTGTTDMHPVPYSPFNKAGIDMEQGSFSQYTENYYQYIQGEKQMKKMYTKPSTVAMTMLLCFALLLGACQSTANNAATSTIQGSSSPAARETAAAGAVEEPATTRIYKHLDGETEIPLEPKRVFTDLKVGQMMALGVKPIGSATYPLQTGFINSEGIEDVGIYPLNLEKLAALEPDLIILTEAWRDGGGYEVFSKIAPTVVIPNHAESMADELRMFGDLLGKKEEGERWLADFEAKVKTAKEKVDAVIGGEETFTILNVRKDAFFIYDDVNMGGSIIYKYLGLKPLEKVQADVLDGEVWEVSAEVVPEYIGDHLLLATNKDAGETLERYEKLWTNTSAVKNDKVYQIDFEQFLLSDPISLSHQLDIITDLLVEKNK
ncbi:AraC family transcriptional regulator [Paenibacillus paeoniae]|uniref:AraC family transcriptional regulator n=1 Tax=Paenibacillus paeoniae TaxID=2292705 RepID=UPI0014024C51|nr:AraC family transcriptional regulator [Paenibacillus paeoniae]